MVILARLRGVSLTQPMLINVPFLSRAEGYRELRNEIHCLKNIQIRIFSGPYFPAFGLNRDQKKLRIWTLFTQ